MRAVTVIPLAWAVQDEGLIGLTGATVVIGLPGAAVVTVALAPGVVGRVVAGAVDSTVRDLTVDAVVVLVTLGTTARVVVGTSSVVILVSARVCASVAAASNRDGVVVCGPSPRAPPAATAAVRTKRTAPKSARTSDM
jgi:hypothetical protein